MDLQPGLQDDTVPMSYVIHLSLEILSQICFLKMYCLLFFIASMDSGLPRDWNGDGCELCIAKENIWLHIGFPESKSVHDLNLFQAYHNAVRLC